MQRNNDANEAINLHLQAAAEQTQAQVFFYMGNVSAYDPATNRIKCVIGNFTNDGNKCMETGFIQLFTPWNGVNFGMQVGPYGGGTVTNPTGSADDGQDQTVFPEQVLVMVVGRESTFYVAGAFLFNNVLTPPGNAQTITDDFGNVTRTIFQSGECVIRHSSGTYIFLRQDGSITVQAATSPQKPFKEPSDTDLTRVCNIGVVANADDQVEEPTSITATTNMKSIIGVQDGSVPDMCQLNSDVFIAADATGGDDVATTISIEANGVTANDGDSGTVASTFSAVATGKALVADGEADLKSTVTGNTSTTNTVNVDADSQGMVENDSTIDIDASTGTGTTNTSTVNITAESQDGADNESDISITATAKDGGNNTSDLSLSSEATGGTATATGEFAVTATGGASTATLSLSADGEISAEIDIAATSTTLPTVNISATGNPTAAIGIESDGEINASAGTTITVTASGLITIASATTVLVQCPVVQLGSGSGSNVLNQVSAAVYNLHTHPDPQGGTTGPPDILIGPSDSALNVFAS
jgi:hypothetical protein